jgi:beta-glucosidase
MERGSEQTGSSSRAGAGHRPAEGEPAYLNRRLSLSERVGDLLRRLSPDEKLGLMASRQEAVPRLGVREFHIGGEAAHGLVTKDGPTTVFPQTIGLACSWDPGLLGEIGSLVGDEARAYYRRRKGLGGLCLWAPTVDMERDPRWGRTEEGYGEDPWLAGELASAFARGMQGDHPFYLKAVPTPKHFYANNNEEKRGSCSASIDPRDRREYYLRAFERVFTDAKALSIMTSYNAINGIPAMLNPELAAVVKGEWGMEGFAVCDGGSLPLLVKEHGLPDAETAAALSLKAGVDNFSDDADTVKAALRGALERGLIQGADLDAAIARVLSVRFRLGHFDQSRDDPYAKIGESAICSRESRALALRAARESIVLLENRPIGAGRVLPLGARGQGSLAVIGPLADAAYRDWYTGTPAYHVTPLKAIAARLPQAQVKFCDGCDVVAFRSASGEWVGTKGWFDGTLVANRPAERGGELFRRTDWGWGNQTFRSLTNGSYVTAEETKLNASAPEVWGWWVKERFKLERADVPAPPCPASSGAAAAFTIQAWNGKSVRLDGSGVLSLIPPGEEDARRPDPLLMEIIHDGVTEAAEAARGAAAAIVFVGNHPLLNAKEEIDRSELALPPEQVRLIEAVLAVNARTVVVIVGSYPFSLGPWREKAAAVLYAAHGGQEAGHALADALFGEHNPAGRLPMTWYRSEKDLPGIMDYDIARGGRTYRHFTGDVLYPFGHGLSYSRFRIGPARAENPRLPRGGVAAIRADVSNEGPLDGEEVIQAYALFPGSALRRPLKKLVGAVRAPVQALRSATVEIKIDARDIMAWNQRNSSWFLESGRIIIVLAGTSAFEEEPEWRKAIVELEIDGETLPPRPSFGCFAADGFEDAENIVLDDSGEVPVPGSCPHSAVRVKEPDIMARLLYTGFLMEAGNAAALEYRVRRRAGSGDTDAGLRVGFLDGSGMMIGDVALPSAAAGPEWTWIRTELPVLGSWTSCRVSFMGALEIHSLRFREMRGVHRYT